MNNSNEIFDNLDQKTNNERKDFFQNIVGDLGPNYLELRFQKNGRMKSVFCKTFDEANQYIEQCYADHDVYFGIAQRSSNTGGGKTDCFSTQVLHLDIDTGSVGHKQSPRFKGNKDFLDFFAKSKFPPPSGIVQTGHGFHFYWKLVEPIIFNETSISRLETLMTRMEKLLGGDSTHDINRIFRVPYTINHKVPDAKVSSFIYSTNYETKYSLEEIENHELLKMPLEKLQKIHYEALFGNIGWNTPDRSSADFVITLALQQAGFSEEQQKSVFAIYPTTGKYETHPSPEKYIDKTIENAKKSKKQQPRKRTDSETHNFDENKEPYFTSDSDANEEISCNLISNLQSKYLEKTDSELGYFYIHNIRPHQISNFVIKLHKFVTVEVDGKDQSYYIGEAILAGGEVKPFQHLDAEILSLPQKFKGFIENVLGPTALITNPAQVIFAMKTFNDVNEIKEVEIGFSPDMTEYYTEDMIITKDRIIKKENLIRLRNSWGNNKLGLQEISLHELTQLKRKIIEVLLDPLFIKENIIILAFIFLCLLDPYIRKYGMNRVYAFIIGRTGTGKSTVARTMKSFFGKIIELTSITSTDTAIGLKGESCKDIPFVLDDIKSENFKSDTEIKRFMALIQNYGDRSGRERSSKTLQLIKGKVINGQLILTGEDNPMTQESSIARGIMIPVTQKPENTPTFEQMRLLSEKLNGFTPYFIQHILDLYPYRRVEKMLQSDRVTLENMLKERGVSCSSSNYPRILNNFIQVMTSWRVLSDFLFDDAAERTKYSELFNESLVDLFEVNLKSFSEERQLEIFAKQYFEQQELKVINIQQSEDGFFPTDGTGFTKPLGYRYKNSIGKITTVVKLENMLNEMKKYFPKYLNISYEHLEFLLMKNDIIKKSNCGRFRIGKALKYGVLLDEVKLSNLLPQLEEKEGEELTITNLGPTPPDEKRDEEDDFFKE